jgi:hypothetical protein
MNAHGSRIIRNEDPSPLWNIKRNRKVNEKDAEKEEAK